MKENNAQSYTIAFWGTPDFAVHALDAFSARGIDMHTIITQPDKPSGRKMRLTPPAVKVWAENHNRTVHQPNSLKDGTFTATLQKNHYDLYIVAAYGNIIPQEILHLPRLGTINIHPSLLPKHRGASPLHQALLEDDETGVTIMLMDEKMDHGPIIASQKTDTTAWPLPITELEYITATQGANMIADILPSIQQHIENATPQDHTKATFTQKVSKPDAEISLSADPLINYRKYCAYLKWPRVYFIDTDKAGTANRVIITSATLDDGVFTIHKVIPAGKKEISYEVYKRQQA